MTLSSVPPIVAIIPDAGLFWTKQLGPARASLVAPPVVRNRTPLPEVGSPSNVLLVMLRSAVPVLWKRLSWLAALSWTVVLPIVLLPEMFMKRMPSSSGSSPALRIELFARLKPLTAFPLIPYWPPLVLMLSMVTPVTFWRWIAPLHPVLPSTVSEPQVAALPSVVPVFVKFMFLRMAPLELIISAPLLVMFCMVPPVPSVVPTPVTLRLPLEPVLFSDMPVGAPLAEMLRKVMSLAPIVVFATTNALAVVVVIMFVPVTLSVPPPVAFKAMFAPVLSVMPPEKVFVEPVLLVRVIPVPVSVSAPVNVALPPVLLVISTESPEVLLMVPE